MNPLQTNTELFCTGKFKAKPNRDSCPPITISALKPDGNYDSWLIGLRDLGGGSYSFYEAKDLTLIARPIESLTDEEIKEYRKLAVTDKVGDFHRETADSLLYALSKGCLPKKFEHCFGDTVIDIHTLTSA